MSEKLTVFTVTGQPLTLTSGALQLSPAQAARRAHALMPQGTEGRYTIRAEVQFKVGEIVGWIGDVPKRLAGNLQPVARASNARSRATAAAGALSASVPGSAAVAA